MRISRQAVTLSLVALLGACKRPAPPPPPPPPALAPPTPAAPPAPPTVAEQKLTELAARLVHVHAPKKPPEEGDWLASNQEPGQTFEQFRTASPVRVDAAHSTLYVTPIGGIEHSSEDLVTAVTEALHLFYGVPVVLTAPLALDDVPDSARRINSATERPQILTSWLLDRLAERRPANAIALIGLSQTDLWPGEGWNFVFGSANPEAHVGVWSTARLGRGVHDLSHMVRRVVQTALHETGHLLGIEHCIAFECGMNGSNNLDENDRNPLPFCPEDEHKVWWATGVDPVTRYQHLADFAHAQGLAAEEAIWRQDLAAISAPAARP